jgi:predicted acylesterase/phospholipase RssA
MFTLSFQAGVKVAGIMGTSAGALAGSLYCAGYSPRQVNIHRLRQTSSHSIAFTVILKVSRHIMRSIILKQVWIRNWLFPMLPMHLSTGESLGHNFSQ